MASNGSDVAELKFTVGHWQEFNLQGIRDYHVRLNGSDECDLKVGS